MAQGVERALTRGGTLVCEAGTGTGKSLGYLVPAALSGRRVIVSTATLALQSQLLRDDLPLAAAARGKPIRAELLKGRSNYACRRMVVQLGMRLFDPMHGEAIERLRPVARHDAQGRPRRARPRAARGRLGGGRRRARALPRRALRVLVDCFAEEARERALDAEVVIVNHALYFADLGLRIASDGAIGVLPEHDAVVFDEAHELEDAAAEWLGARLSLRDVTQLRRDCERACRLDNATSPARMLHELERAAHALFARLPAARGRTRLREAELRDLAPREAAARAPRARQPDGAAGRHGGGARRHRAPRGAPARRARRLPRRRPRTARRVERARRRRARAALGARVGRAAPARAPLGPPACGGAHLGHALDRGRSLASRARAWGSRARASSCWPRRSTSRPRRGSTCRATRPTRAPPGWDQAIADHIAAIVRASDGRALCLFTSWRALESVRGLVAAELGAYTLLVQGEAPRERLLEAFRADVHSVLLATQSFWQGVDIRGEACSCVIIDRLPFAVPSDPLVAGRCEQIVRDGGSAFDDYALPQAALMLRQGFGRLLRSHDDRGVVAVLDGRLNTARYAEPLLAALPPVPRVHEIADVEAFFARPVELAT